MQQSQWQRLVSQAEELRPTMTTTRVPTIIGALYDRVLRLLFGTGGGVTTAYGVVRLTVESAVFDPGRTWMALREELWTEIGRANSIKPKRMDQFYKTIYLPWMNFFFKHILLEYLHPDTWQAQQWQTVANARFSKDPQVTDFLEFLSFLSEMDPILYLLLGA